MLVQILLNEGDFMKKLLFTLLTAVTLISGAMVASAPAASAAPAAEQNLFGLVQEAAAKIKRTAKEGVRLAKSGYSATTNYVVSNAPASVRPHLTKTNVALALTTLIFARKLGTHKLAYYGTKGLILGTAKATKALTVGTAKVAFDLVFGPSWF